MDISTMGTVLAIVVITYLIGLLCKSVGSIRDELIPVIVGAAGGVLGIVGMYVIPDFPAKDVLNALAVGIVSGLASTGVNQVYKQEKWGYIWGGTGQVHTQRAQDSATRAQTIRYGQQWVGRRVADCSGLFWWAYKQLGGYMYHGSNTMWRKYAAAKGALQGGKRTDGQPLKPGTAVFLTKGSDRHHVGLYVGDGKVIEAMVR